MTEHQKQISAVIQKLASVPERLARAIAGKTTKQLQQRPATGEWAANEILAHIRTVDAIVAPRIYMLLTHEGPLFVDFDERRWAEIARYVDRDFHQSLSLFTLHQEELAAVLQQLPVQTWQRTGRHEIRGTLSLLDIVQDLANHEEEHCLQLEALFVP